MDSETRQKRIEELKALRAELMAYKEEIDGESGEGTASNTDMATLRRAYAEDFSGENEVDTEQYGDARQKMYSQQETEENSETKQLTLYRRR